MLFRGSKRKGSMAITAAVKQKRGTITIINRRSFAHNKQTLMSSGDRQQFVLGRDGRYRRMEGPIEDQFGSTSNFGWLVAVTVILTGLLISYIATSVLLDRKYSTWNTENVKTISGVAPDAGNNVEATAGLGLGFTPLPLTNSFVYDNQGVVTLNGQSSVDPTRDFTLAVTGPALGLTPGASTLTWSSPAMVGINGISAVANDFTLAVTGPALTLTPGVSSLTFGSPALVTINGQGGVANDFQIVGGTAINVGTVGNVATIDNTGVTEIVAGAGITANSTTGSVGLGTTAVLTINGQAAVANDFQIVASNGITIATVGNTATVSDSLADATQLADTDALGPAVHYEVAIGFFVPVAENSGWRTGVVPGFPMPFIPGSVDDGQGNAGGTGWNVPAIGSYNVHVDCEVLPSAIAANDLQIVSAAFTLAAQTEDPLALAILPAGAYNTMDISGGTNANVAAPTVPRRLSLSSTFQAGCVGCLVQVGDALNIHMSMERTGVLPGPYTVNGYCQVDVTRIR